MEGKMGEYHLERQGFIKLKMYNIKKGTGDDANRVGGRGLPACTCERRRSEVEAGLTTTV